MASFTKNKSTGEYDVIGTPEEIVAGRPVTVTKADGSTTTVTIGSVGRPFTAKFGALTGRQAVIGTVVRSRQPVGSGSGRGGYSSSGYSRGTIAPGGRRCSYCGSRECARAWDPRDLCDED